MSHALALPKPRGRWRVILLSGLLALFVVLLLQPMFLWGSVQVRAHTDLQAIRDHILRAYDQGVLAEDGEPAQFIHRGGHIFTECIAMVVALDNQMDLVRSVVFPTVPDIYHRPELFRSICAELRKLASGVSPVVLTGYARYWHGYRVYLWPLLERFDLATVKLINALLVAASLFACCAVFRHILGATPAMVWLIGLLSFSNLLLIWRDTPHSISMSLTLLGVAAFGLLHQKSRNPYIAVLLAAQSGAVFNFVDFLVNPPIMPMLMAFLVLAVERQQADRGLRRDTIGAEFLAALVMIAWFGAYALTWATKWGLALWWSENPGETGQAILEQIFVRLRGHEIGHPPELMIPLYPSVRAFGKAFFLGYGSVLGILLSIAIYVFVQDHRHSFDRRRFLLLSSPALIAIVWFELLNNHTQTHLRFTYRSASVAITIILTSALLATRAPVTISELLAGLRRYLRRRFFQTTETKTS